MPDRDVRQASTGTPQSGGLSEASLLACVQAAVAAASLHNGQPWRFRIRNGGVDVYADRTRQLEVIDPSGRELLISVGAAVFNLRVAIRQQGWVPVGRTWPDADESELVARIRPGPAAARDPAMDALAAAIPRRHTNRHPFDRVVVPAAILEELAEAAATEGAALSIAGAVGRTAILSLVRSAEQRLRAQGRYRAELTDWTRPTRGRRDGVPPQAFGPWAALETLPLRDYGLTQPQLQRRDEPFEPYPTILVLFTNGDTPDQWVRAGQALQRVLLLATVHGLAATPMSQPLEIPALRELVTDTRTGRWAQVILRVGYGQATAVTPPRRGVRAALRVWRRVGDGRGHPVQERPNRRSGDAAHDRPVQRGPGPAERRPVAADQPQPRPVIALPHQCEVGVQHREQLTGDARGLPPQRDRHRDATANRVQNAHPHQLGQPGCAAEWTNANERLQPSLVRSFGHAAQSAPVDQVHQPRSGHLIPGLDRDLVDGEHLLTVLASQPRPQSRKSTPAAAEVDRTQGRKSRILTTGVAWTTTPSHPRYIRTVRGVGYRMGTG